MIRFLLLSVFAISIATATTHADDLTLVTDKSKIDFTGSKPDGKHDGGFKAFEVTATLDVADPTASTIAIKIDATSLWSDNDKLTNHLKNPDFFDVRKHPEISFESTQVVPGDEEGKGTIKGKLTMLGQTQEVEVPVVADAKDDVITLNAQFKIDRTKWGMDYGQGKVDNEVAIAALLVFKR